MEQLLTVAQVAERLGISKPIVYEMCKREGAVIRHLRLGIKGATIRIPEDALREYIDRATVEPTPAKPPPRTTRAYQILRSPY